MRKLDKVLAAALIVTAGLLPGQAQEADHQPLTFSVWVTAKATDNRDSAAAGLEEDNLDILLSPKVEYVLGGSGRTSLDFFYQPAYRYRSDPSPTQNENDWYHEAGIEFTHQQTKRLAIRFFDLFTYNEDPSVTDENGNVRQDGSFKMNRVNLGFDYKLSQRSVGRFDIHNRIRQAGRPHNLRRARQRRSLRLGHGLTQALHGLGRRKVRTRI